MVHQALAGDAREPDGKLHASSHLTAPLRHVQLELAGAPQKPRTIGDEITLMTGTLWHRYLEDVLRGLHIPVMTEVKLDKYMPEGWSGTADWIFWNDEYQAFVLGDLKTIKSAGLPWILSGGAKEAHLFQLSAYWYALRDMGLPLVEGFAVLYLPKDDVPGKDMRPTVMECSMVDESILRATMELRKEQVDEYLDRSDIVGGGGGGYYSAWLAPAPERELKRIWNAKQKVFDVVLKPHWSAAYCRFEDCGCGSEGQQKIGHYVSRHGLDTLGGEPFVEWVPRDPDQVGTNAWLVEPDIDIRPQLKDFK